ncbi:MAG TPA: hypothetical protein VN019_03510, partial [Oxalicibacterium sp.]|nr:hypothetical protein [Oxalicibacterium sp.]
KNRGQESRKDCRQSRSEIGSQAGRQNRREENGNENTGDEGTGKKSRQEIVELIVTESST